VVCELYQQAPDLHELGVHVLSTDEKTGMQALERKYPVKPSRPGLIEREEFEYIRHGALCLTANFEVATGRVVSPTVQQTRNSADFVAHIERTMSSDPEGRWTYVVDNLDTHKSEALVRFVARRLRDTTELGVMSESGVLKSRATRTAYLSAPEHRIRFVYTPRHCSWLNQIEMWFSVLSRRFLRRASFRSLLELQQRLLGFIEYFNAVLAKPYRWTFTGRPLTA